MEKEQGLNIIEQALNLANSKGAFKLEESATVFAAFVVIKTAIQEVELKPEKELIKSKVK